MARLVLFRKHEKILRIYAISKVSNMTDLNKRAEIVPVKKNKDIDFKVHDDGIKYLRSLWRNIFFTRQVKNSIWNGMEKDEIEQRNITAWRRKHRAGR